MIVRTASVSFVVLLGLFIVACSGSPSTGSSQSQVKAGSTKKGASDDPNQGANDKTSPPAANAPSGATCGAKANHEECFDCCWGKDGASGKADSAAFNACECALAKSKCTAECAKPFCDTSSDSSGTAVSAGGGTSSGSSDNDPCAACQFTDDDFKKCDAEAKKACDADPACAAASKCYADAKCDGKPPGPNEDASSSSESGSSGSTSGSAN
jgi:hypothetical protein